ncbi:MAG: hypothetical protein RL318_2537 [Fibrobacterota bacterium]|jgi:hypothetical protein
MDAVRVDGNLQQLAAMVRGNAKRPDVVVDAPAAPKPALPDSTLRIARGLSDEVAPPMRDEDDVDAMMMALTQEMRSNSAQALQAHGQLHEGTVRNLI